jgi:hypothetical protein
VPRHAAPAQRRPGDLLVRLGVAVFVVGAVGALLVVVPFLIGGRREAPLALDLLALLLPLGLGLALLGLLRSARSHQERVHRTRTELAHLDRHEALPLDEPVG